MRSVIAIFSALLLLPASCKVSGRSGVLSVPDTIYVYDREGVNVDSLGRTFIIIDHDTLHTSFLPSPELMYHRGPLKAEDYEEIAAELGVETAAIRAIVDIETGRIHRGLNEDGSPVINFDLAIFRRTASKRGISLKKHSSSPALKALDVKRYGSQQAAHHARLAAAMEIDSAAAIESTFWGMFQIGGFNWKLCGMPSPQEFAARSGRSEYDQLKLFSNFIRNTGMLPYLKKKNWAAFARAYNGPSYAKRGYHTRMAKAYKQYKAEEKRNKK